MYLSANQSVVGKKQPKSEAADKGTNGPYLAYMASTIAKRMGVPFDDIQDGVEDSDQQ